MADKAMLGDLTKVATRFRHMIENADWSKLPDEFKDFPGKYPPGRHSGGRAEVPILLAQYLIDLGYGIPTYVRSELYDPDLRWGHAWLELNDVVIDIALDGMFADVPPVIVTEGLYWHEVFKRLDENPVAIHVFDERTVSMLRTACHEIIGLRTHLTSISPCHFGYR